MRGSSASTAAGLAAMAWLTAASSAGAAPATAAQARVAAPGRAAPAGSDPFEGFNRAGFAINQWIDRHALRPLAVFYKRATPRPVRSGLHNAFQNLGEPLVAVNDLMQGRIGDFGRSSGRFAANSTFGLAGLFDIAARGGVPHHDNGFGLTLARAGVRPGPYLFIPLMGPSTVRDSFGSGVDSLLNPFTWINYPHRTPVSVGSTVIGGLDLRAAADKDLKTLHDLSTDDYATLRSFYLQNRQAQVTGGVVDVNALPDFDDPGAPAGSPTPAAPAAPGSVSPTGDAALPALPGAPAGEAGALPHPAGSPDAQKP